MTEGLSLEVERRMQGPPDQVFAHFTEPELHVRWCGVAVDLDPRPGGTYAVSFGDNGEIRGEYVSLDPPRRLVLLWGWHDAGGTEMSRIAPSSTRVEIDFVEDGEDTLVRLRQFGIPEGPVREFVTWGWSTYLDRLVLESAGETPVADPFATLGTAAIG